MVIMDDNLLFGSSLHGLSACLLEDCESDLLALLMLLEQVISVERSSTPGVRANKLERFIVRDLMSPKMLCSRKCLNLYG